jgi:hypothetical protein
MEGGQCGGIPASKRTAAANPTTKNAFEKNGQF